MTQRYFPKPQSLPTTAKNASSKPAFGVYSDTPGTPNQWKQVTDRSTAAWNSVYASRHSYSQFFCVDDNDGFFTLAHRQRYTLDNGFDADYGSHIYFPRAVPGKPNEIVGAKDSDKTKLIRYNYATNTETLIRSFSNTITIGKQQGGLSRDGSRLVVQEDTGGGSYMCYLLNIDTNTIISQKSFSSTDDSIGVHPDGYHILEYDTSSHDNGGGWNGYRSYRVYDENFNLLRTVGVSGHIGLGFDFDDTTPVIVGEIGWEIVKINLTNGAVDRIAGGPSRFQNNPLSLSLHVAYCYDLPGHFVLTAADPDGPSIVYTITTEPSDGNSENAMLWGYHNCNGAGNFGGNYYSQPHANVTNKGDRVIWVSDWGVGNNQTDVYNAVETYLCQTKPSNAPVFSDQSFTVAQNASVGTVVGQLSATDPQNSNNSITSGWKLQHLRNSGFAVSSSGQITVAESSATSDLGAQTTAVIVEGSVAQTANDVTITVGEGGGSASGLSHTHDLATSQSTFDTRRTIQSVGARSSGGGTSTLHWNPGAVYATAKDGNDQDAYTVMKSAINGNKNKVDDNGDYVYKTFMVSVLWKWGEPGNQNYSSGSAWQFIDDCIALLNSGQTLGIYWIDRRFNASDISKTPIPSDLRSYPNSYFYPSGETLATANLARPNVNDRKVELLKETGRRYNDNSAVVFITSGETSIHLPSGNVTDRAGNSVSHNESYFNELKHLFNEAKTELSNILLLTEINFIGTFDSRNNMQLARAIINNMISTGGGGFSLPDSLACRHPAEYVARCCDTAGSYRIAVYDLMTEYQGQIVIAPHAQTWSMEHDRFDEDFDMMTDGAGQYSWHSHYPIFWPDSFVSRCSKYGSDSGGASTYNGNSIDYEAMVRAEIINNPTGFSTTLPGSAGGTQSGVNPVYADVTFSGTELLVSDRSGTTVNDVDEFTVVFSDAPTVDEPAILRFSDSGVGVITCDGTATSEVPVLIVLSAADVVANGEPTWNQIPAPAGSAGATALQASGYNNTPGSDHKVGSFIQKSLAGIIPDGVEHHLYLQVQAAGAQAASSDSFWLSVNDEDMTWDQPIYNSDGNPHWQHLRHTADLSIMRTVTSADTFKIWCREDESVISAFHLIPVAESALPAGQHGFCTTAVSFPAGISVEMPESMTINVDQEYTIDTNFMNANTLDIFTSAQTSGNIEILSVANDQIIFKGINVSSGEFVSFVVTETGSDPLKSVSYTTNLTVVGAGGSNWPSGIDATLADPFSVTLDNTFSLPAYPVNSKNFALLSDRWYSDSAAVILQSDTNSVGTFHAAQLGTATIYYTMEREGNSSNSQVFTTTVTIVEEIETEWPGNALVDVGADRSVTTEQSQAAFSAEHVDGFAVDSEWTANDAGVTFTSDDSYTKINTPGAGQYLITRTLRKSGDASAPIVEDSFTLIVREPIELAPRNDRFCSEPRIAVELVTAGGSVWVRDYPTTPVPNGAVVLDAEIEQGGISTVSQRVNIRKGSSDIGTATLKFVDHNRSLTEWLHSVLSSGNTLLNQQVKIYRMCKGQEFNHDKLWRTYIFDKYSSKDNLYTFNCKDVQRFLQKDITSPHTGRLAKSIAVDDMAIPVIRPDGYFIPHVHSSDYKLHPGKSVMYVQIKSTKEVFAADKIYTNAEDGAEYFNVIERGVLQTIAAAVKVNDDTSEDNLPGLTEIIYIAGPGPEVAYQLKTGVSRDGAITLPDHWHAHVPTDLVDRDSFTNIGEDIESTYLEFVNPKKQTAKNWIETQCYVPMRCVPFVNSYGAITLRRSQSATPDAASIGTLTADDIISYSDYSTDFGTIKNGLLVNWGWNWATETFLQPTLIVDSQSQNQHGYTEYETLSLKGLQSSAETGISVKTTADVIRGHISHEGLGLTIKVMPDRDYYDAGDVIRLELGDLVKDPSGQTVELNRSMLITRRSENIYTGDISYQLYGIGRAIESIAESSNNTPIPIEQLSKGATALSSVCTIVNGEIQGVNNIPAGVYYFDSDLSHDPDTGQIIQSTPGTIELRVAGAYNPYHPKSIVTKGMGGAGGAGQTAYGTPPSAGGAGYFGSITSANGLQRDLVYTRDSNNSEQYHLTNRAKLSDIPGAKTRGTVSSMPLLPLKLAAGVLTGYPKNISGSGSPGAGAHTVKSQEPNRHGDAPKPINTLVVTAGADGVPGGGGISIISRGGSTGPAGGFDISGEDGIQGGYSSNTNVFAGSSAGGMPGCLLWQIDGDHFAPTLQGRVTANAGAAIVDGANAVPGNTHKTSGSDIRPSIDPDGGGDYSGACVSVQYIPTDSIPQQAALLDDSSLSPYLTLRLAQFQAEAQNQIDDTLKVIADDAKPSYGTKGDRWVATAERNAGGYPAIYNHDGSDYQPEDPATSFVAKMLQIQYGTAYIADGKGAVYLNDSTDPNPPTPTSISDLWAQPNTGKVYPAKTTAGGLIWDFDKTVADEMSMPTSGNLLHDPTFDEVANKGKATWSSELQGDDAGEIGYVRFQNGQGEGGGPGALIVAEDLSAGEESFIVCEQFYPARRGEVIRVAARFKNRDLTDGRPYVKLLAYDANKDLINVEFKNRAIVQSIKQSENYRNIARAVEIDSLDTAALESVNYVRVAAGVTGTLTGDRRSYTRFDYIAAERYPSLAFRQINLAAYPLDTVGPSASTQSVAVYSADDVFTVDFNFDAYAPAESVISCNVSESTQGGEYEVFKNLVLSELPNKGHYSGQAVFHGLVVGENVVFRVLPKTLASGSMWENARIRVTVDRADDAEL